MTSENSPVSLNVLGKEYLVACPEEEQEALLASAKLLNEKIKEVQHSGRVIGMDRITVMAALNLAHEMLRDKNIGLDKKAEVRLTLIQDKIETALSKAQQMEL